MRIKVNYFYNFNKIIFNNLLQIIMINIKNKISFTKI